MNNVVCFGEILWDVFPTHKVIGGAPLNVALRLNTFGVHTSIISRLGTDAYAKRALDYLQQVNLSERYVQKDTAYTTGYVSVLLDYKGSASYEIYKPVAWDFIALDEANRILVSETDIFIFGSLACRNEVSRQTLFKLLEQAKFSVFDVNLRKPDYTFELLIDLMQKANVIKLNDDELQEIASRLGVENSTIKVQVETLSRQTRTQSVCVTRGSQGALLYWENGFYENTGYQVAVKDTVGAGDSFLAALIFKLFIRKESPDTSLDFACRIGALVASKEGANATVHDWEIMELTKSS